MKQSPRDLDRGWALFHVVIYNGIKLYRRLDQHEIIHRAARCNHLNDYHAFEFVLCFDLAMKHNRTASRDKWPTDGIAMLRGATAESTRTCTRLVNAERLANLINMVVHSQLLWSRANTISLSTRMPSKGGEQHNSYCNQEFCGLATAGGLSL